MKLHYSFCTMLIVVTAAATTNMSFAANNNGDRASSYSDKRGGQSTNDNCNRGLVIAVGAIVGVAIAHKKNRIGAAIVGGAVGLAVCEIRIRFKSKKQQSSKTVNGNYVSNSGHLPSELTIVEYETSLSPGKVAPRGSTVSVDSVLTVVGSKGRQMQEELVLFDTEGNYIRSKRKHVGSKHPKAGKYWNSFQFKLPEGIPQGEYKIVTTLYLDGELVKSNVRDFRAV